MASHDLAPGTLVGSDKLLSLPPFLLTYHVHHACLSKVLQKASCSYHVAQHIHNYNTSTRLFSVLTDILPLNLLSA